MADASATRDIERVIAAAGAGVRTLRSAVRNLGLSRCTELFTDEVVFRCGRCHRMSDALVELEITDAGRRSVTPLLFRSGSPVTVAESGNAPAVLRVSFDLTDLAAELYGPCRDRSVPMSSTTALPALDADPATGMPDWALLDSTSRACDQLLAACSASTPDLGAMALDRESDKWGALHRFTPHYDRHLRHLRNDAVRVLEIGIGGYGFRDGGGSLAMWKHYFHRGLVFGLDIFDKSHADQPRVQTLIGDQNDPAYLTAMAAEYGPFDVIIDDGSHVNEHVRTSFAALFEHVAPGGLYIVEDLWTTYAPGFGGSATRVAGEQTSLAMVKNLLDGLHHEERPAGDETNPTDRGVAGVHVYHNIAFLEKGVNVEGGIPSWVPRSLDDLMA